MKKMIFASAFSVAAAFAALPATAQEGEAAAVEAVAAETVVAEVNGLVCDFCAQALNKVFKKTGAVETVDVDLDAGLVSIVMKPGETLDDETIQTLIKKGGYSFVSMERTGGA